MQRKEPEWAVCSSNPSVGFWYTGTKYIEDGKYYGIFVSENYIDEIKLYSKGVATRVMGSLYRTLSNVEQEDLGLYLKKVKVENIGI